MSEQPFERLAYRNRFVKNLIQETEGTDCFVPFVNLNEVENLVVLKLSAFKINRMFSALITGADITYPDESMQIMVDFLSGIHCPPVLEDQECFEYPSYASFMQYAPMNPYLTPDEIPDGYETVPFEINGQNGVDLPNYEHFDIIVPSSALTLDVNWFTDIGGQLPQITIMVQGAGKAFIKLLSIVGGGLVVITVDNPPDILDILGGIISGGDNIIDLNQDIVSLPPETAIETIYELDIVGSGLHTIYMVFLPILDDSLIPLRFGGGFRGVQLCDFVEQPEMGITNIRFNDATCNLEVLEGGDWSVVDGWENWLDCIPDPGGGGSVGAAVKVFTHDFRGSGTTTTTSTSFVDLLSFVYTPTHRNMLVQFSNATLLNSNAGGHTDIRITFNGAAGLDASVIGVVGSSGRQVAVSDQWAAMTVGAAHSINLQFRTDIAATATCNFATDIMMTVIEFDDLAALFVEDVRIVGRELQKKIAGVWITVSDSLASILNSIESTANTALVNANNAISVNTSQQTQINAAVTVNNTQNTRLTLLESNVSALQGDFNGMEILVGKLAFGGVWAQSQSLNSSSYFWTMVIGSGYVAGSGFRSNVNGLTLNYSDARLDENQTTHIHALIIMNSAPTGTLQWRVNGGAYGSLNYAGVGGPTEGWLRVPNTIGTTFQIEFLGFGDFYLRSLYFLGRGENNPFA